MTVRYDDREFYTVPEVAELLGVHPDWLRRHYLHPNGDLPCYRIGTKTIRILGVDLHTWMEARRSAPPTPATTRSPDDPGTRRRRRTT